MSFLDIFAYTVVIRSEKVTNSFLREFCAQMSESVFLAVLIVLQLISTV